MGGTDDASGNRSGVAELLWGQPRRPKRGPQPMLTLTAIAEAGIRVADADGLAAVSMQRVAGALGFTKMSLYRYVPGKVELVALMTDIGLGPPPDLDAIPAGWRPALTEWSRRMFDRFWQHPWALEATVGCRVPGPNELGWMEQAVAALAGTGLNGGEMLDVAATLNGHVRSIAQHGTAAGADPPEQSMDSAIAMLLRGRRDRFPALAAAVDSAAAHGTQDQALEFGIDRILDGVERYLSGE